MPEITRRRTGEMLRQLFQILLPEPVGGFTKDASEEARKQEKRKITLLDNEALFDLWSEYYEKLDDQARRRLPLRRIYFLAPEP